MTLGCKGLKWPKMDVGTVNSQSVFLQLSVIDVMVGKGSLSKNPSSN